jgi:hypothetical protein
VHLRHLLTPVLLAVAAVPLVAAPATAAQGPAGRDTGVHLPRLACTGDTVQVTAVVRGQRDVGPATVTLQAASGGVWSTTGRSTSVARTKPGHNSWTLDASGLRAGVTSLRAEIRAAGATVLTPAVPASSCAPGTEVPEVPVPALLPLTLAATATGVLALRSRRAGRLPA